MFHLVLFFSTIPSLFVLSLYYYILLHILLSPLLFPFRFHVLVILLSRQLPNGTSPLSNKLNLNCFDSSFPSTSLHHTHHAKLVILRHFNLVCCVTSFHHHNSISAFHPSFTIIYLAHFHYSSSVYIHHLSPVNRQPYFSTISHYRDSLPLHHLDNLMNNLMQPSMQPSGGPSRQTTQQTILRPS